MVLNIRYFKEKRMFDIKKAMCLYAVTDRAWTERQTLIEQVEDAIKGGVTCVQLREKDMPDDEFLKEALTIKEICKKYGVPFIINDNVEIAVKSGADGIHVGQSDMQAKNVRKLIGDEMILGVSAQTVEQALEAQNAGADYLGVGAVFHTDTKTDADDVSSETLKEICNAVNIPVVAIGGINKGNIMELKGTDIDGVALVSAIFAADNIEEECKELYTLSKAMIKHTKTALTIAGSDSSGGAGIQADIKTMTANGVYAMSAITALTSQNTMGVKGIFEVTPEFLKEQLDCVFTDIFPDAVKIGMVASGELIKVIAERLKFYNAKNIIVDPVMVATSGSSLIETDAITTLKNELLPIATLVTPNIPEAEVLSGMKITNETEMLSVAEKISKEYSCAVLLKGGHSINDANDLLYYDGRYEWFYGKRINNPNTHGTGCTLSSAIASNMAKGFTLEMSVKRAKDYISGALADGMNLGKGSGPLNHAFDINGEFAQEV